jgi:hypothetical protein
VQPIEPTSRSTTSMTWSPTDRRHGATWRVAPREVGRAPIGARFVRILLVWLVLGSLGWALVGAAAWAVHLLV